MDEASPAATSEPPHRHLPRRTLVVVVLAALAVVAVALVLTGVGGRDEGPPPVGSVDLGDQSDPARLGQLVDGALARSGPRLPERDVSCGPDTRRMYGRGLGPLLYTAGLRWQGTPAVLLTYRSEGDARVLRHRVFVMERGTCRLLVVQSL